MTARSLTSAAVIAALIVPQAAEAACSLRLILGKWALQMAATEYVYPDRNMSDLWEENSHVSSEVRLRRIRGKVATVSGVVIGQCSGWSTYGSLTPAGAERQRFLLRAHG